MSEKLRKVAERLYPKRRAYVDNGRVMLPNTIYDDREFNPRTNPAQLKECIEWLLAREYAIGRVIDTWLPADDYIVYKGAPRIAAPTLADAVINAIAGEEE